MVEVLTTKYLDRWLRNLKDRQARLRSWNESTDWRTGIRVT